jgi:high-affinity K+ transport system ATPase subunit B
MSSLLSTIIFTAVSIIVLIVCAIYGERTWHKINNKEL